MSGPILAPRAPWLGRHVVLGVTGGIAAYKSVQLARDLTRLGARVDTVLTESAGEFVRPLTFQGVTGRAVYHELFDAGGAARHIELGADADLVLVAPATADLIARAAHGRADDLLTTTLLATRAPILLAPAMNDRMYGHPQTQRNLAHCREVLGYRILGPGVGPLAAGEGEGPGRMLEPSEIVDHVGRAVGGDPVFEGRRVVVTAGPTREPLDPIRFLGNRSSGRMGFALAREAWLRGAEVTLVTGPSALPDPTGVTVSRVETASEMLTEVTAVVPEADLVFFAAAVGDFRSEVVRDRKMKRSDMGGDHAPETRRELRLVENPDIALETRALGRDGAVRVGFALETEDLLTGARRKLREKGFDLIVANDAGEEGAGFEVETNRVTLLWPDGEEENLPIQSKRDVARAILERLRERLRPPSDSRIPATSPRA